MGMASTYSAVRSYFQGSAAVIPLIGNVQKKSIIKTQSRPLGAWGWGGRPGWGGRMLKKGESILKWTAGDSHVIP